ncbi:nucleotide exchange factor GrpE [Microlunatus capsulatus]|uniref:Molecular chaperone GrpE (Heat shock protein) n=1 Tax=Microlunatus capsulatus TaxID=99117 RepID=A0ABS4Z824_9ACTN|nr:nucleotide exchange factor GrpE [Microlunatus capsulatus]MBP2417198.1 molecular chaperone GrpE (heat shock protein) [Microlunatus capsulatus]
MRSNEPASGAGDPSLPEEAIPLPDVTRPPTAEDPRLRLADESLSAGSHAGGADPEGRQNEQVSPSLADDLAAIRAELVALRSETQHVNAILDRLHAENEQLRRGEADRQLQPIFRDLIKLADDWQSMGKSWSGRESATPDDVVSKCLGMAEDAALILERHGVDLDEPEPGDVFDRRRHRALASVSTEDPSVAGRVKEVRRPGYVLGGKVLRFAEVVVFRS